MTPKNMSSQKITLFSKKMLNVQGACHGGPGHLGHLAHVGIVHGKPLSGAPLRQNAPKVRSHEEKLLGSGCSHFLDGILTFSSS